MRSFLLRCLMGVILIVGVVSTTPVSIHAAINDDSPFISQTDTGQAEEINVVGTDTQQQDSVVNIVKSIINRVLGILGFIALVVILYGGLLMVTAAGEGDRYDKGFTILKQAAIGLVLIGIAWFIVSIIFWLINVTTEQTVGQGAGTL